MRRFWGNSLEIAFRDKRLPRFSLLPINLRFAENRRRRRRNLDFRPAICEVAYVLDMARYLADIDSRLVAPLHSPGHLRVPVST